MAEDLADLALTGIDHSIDNYEKVWDPLKSRTQKMKERRRNRNGKDRRGDYDDFDEGPTPDQRGWVLKKRSEVRSDEEIVDRVSRDQQVMPYRPKPRRRASSLNGDNYRDGRSDRRADAYRGRDDGYDSEGSVPPRDRRSRKKSGRSSSKSSSSSEDLGASSEDERRCKKVERTKWLTGGLAAVATIHAAAKVYSSLEDRDKRVQKVLSGELSPEKARHQRNRSRWQDAAALSVAAIGIRGAMGEWHEVEEKQEEAKKVRQEREERHLKRLERQKRLQEKERGQLAIEDRRSDRGNDRHRSKSSSAYDYGDDRSGALARSRSRY